ncbi:MAG: hypothetical protein ABW277_09130 [Longimicrobiaceae bacterium]
MKRLDRKVLQGAFNALMLGVVCVGAGKALSSPAAAQITAGFCSASEQRYCNEYCMSLYPQGALSRCIKYSTGAVNCNCQPF